MLTTGLWLAAIGIVALSLENFVLAVGLFGIAGWLIGRQLANRYGRPTLDITS